MRKDIKEEEIADFLSVKQLPDMKPFCPNEGEALNVLSLFSGCGGMDIGFEGGFICHKKSIVDPQAFHTSINEDWGILKGNRFRTIFANDILKEAKSAWLKYMSRHNVSPETYHAESIVELVKRAKQGETVFPKHVDVVTGGFPCQDFSLAGKRKGFNSEKSHNGQLRDIDTPSEETRGKLYFWMKQVIDITKPKIFIAENVKGLISLGDAKRIIQHDFASADGNDYIVLPPQVLHAGDYGVPETRERVIFIGIRRSALNPTAQAALSQEDIPAEYNPYPTQTHDHTGKNPLLPCAVPCEEIFKGIKEPEESKDLAQQLYSKAKYLGKHCQGQSEIDIKSMAPTIRSEHHGNIEYRRLSQEHEGKYTEELSMGLKERRLTPRECALIQTFPPDYPFVFKSTGARYGVSSSGAYKVIGNAVPPVLAYHIARRLEEVWERYFGR